MLEIKGTFSTGEAKQAGKNLILNIINSEKNKDTGEYDKTYYQMWLTDKTKNLLGYNVLKRIENQEFCLIEIEGLLKVTKNGNYTNLTIIPQKIVEKRLNR